MVTFTNLATAHRRALPDYADLPAISVGTEVVLDHAQLADRAARLAAGLVTRGLRPGDRVALVNRDQAELYPMLLAIWHAGLTAVPIAPTRPAEQIAWILQDSGATLCMIDRDSCPSVDAALARHPEQSRRCARSSVEQLYRTAPILPRVGPEGPQGIAWLLYTPGTTGRPKGVMLSHQNLASLIERSAEPLGSPGPGDNIIHLDPDSSDSVLTGLCHLLAGGNQVIPRRPGPDDFEQTLELLEYWSNATVVLPPPGVVGLAKRAATQTERLASLRTILCGGAPLSPRDARRALAVFGPKLVGSYGPGEAPLSVMLDRRECEQLVITCRGGQMPVGRVPAGWQLRVIDPEGNPVPAGQLGEVLLQGPSIMRGYWNAPETTARVLRDGWLHTGDLGWCDDEGRLFILGRAQDAIRKPRGPMHPHAIERHLLRHPAIRELAVVGRSMVTRREEEEPIAFVCRQPGANATVGDLVEHCRSLTEDERPAAFIFVEELPRGDTGKVLRRRLRERVATPQRIDGAAAELRRLAERS